MTTVWKPKPLLVYPPITRLERYGSAIGAAGGQQIPLGMYYLAAYLRSKGYETDVIDAETLDSTNEDIIAHLRVGEFNIMGISSTTVAFHRAYELAKAAKAASPETIIVLGGPHISCLPRHAMEFGVFDFAIRNEGEETLAHLLDVLARDKDFSKVAGLIFRRDGQVVVNPQRPYVEDIDSLPMPAYDLIGDIRKYAPPPCNYKLLPVANIITSRGCPNQCTFCDNSTFGRKVRMRSAEGIVDEIELLIRTYGVREIAFVDDTFTIRPKRIYEIFDLARARGLRFPWTCMSRINTVDEKLLRYMKENGCWHISFGIESADETVLKTIRKNISLPDVERVVDICHQFGILTKGFFIVGHPTETVETIDKTIDFATKLKLDDVVVTINTPIPGSYQYEHVDEYGCLDTSSWSQFNYWKPVFVPHALTRELLLAKHKEFYRKFYLRPRIIWRYFKSLFSPTGMRRLGQLVGSSRFLFQRTTREAG
ncbi:MAG: radical SAM protein [Phycisphaerae bacterium]|nr:radical SAM protein [Phycisphaerae bacterium]